MTEWLKYQSLHFETGDIDWIKTYELLQFQKMDGKMLPHINKMVLPLIGITDTETIEHLLSSIGTLLKRTKSNVSKSMQIPSEFLCPISKKVMTDPVIACDGHTYERSQIEDYLKKHDKSPVTNKAIEQSFVFPNEAMKKQIADFLKAESHYCQGECEDVHEGQ